MGCSGTTLLAVPLAVLAVLLSACDFDPDVAPRGKSEAEVMRETQIAKGRDLFTQNRCVDCHVIEENDFTQRDGPDLTYFGDKAKVDASKVRDWILKPDMPVKNYPDHPKIADHQARNFISQFLQHSRRLPNYVPPPYEGDRRLQAHCVVTGVRVLKETADQREYQGTIYYFASASAARKFDSAPAHYTK